jgi:hypothetical protein
MADRPTLVTVEYAFARRGGTPTGSELTRAEALLVDVSEEIRDIAELTWLNDAETEVEGVPYPVQAITRAATVRAFDNPEGLSQRSIGDSSKSYDRSGREGGEVVYLTRREEAAVRKAAAGSSFRSMTLVSPWNGAETDWLTL